MRRTQLPQTGDRVQLIGKRLGRGAPRVLGEGVYRAVPIIPRYLLRALRDSTR